MPYDTVSHGLIDGGSSAVGETLIKILKDCSNMVNSNISSGALRA